MEIIAENVNILIHEPYTDAHDAYLDDNMETDTVRIISIRQDVEGLRKDGTTFSMNLGISELNVDCKTLFLGAVRNVTQRMLAENVLQEQTRLVRLLLTMATQANGAASTGEALFARRSHHISG